MTQPFSSISGQRLGAIARRIVPVLAGLVAVLLATLAYWNYVSLQSDGVTTLNNVKRLATGRQVTVGGIVTLTSPKDSSFYLQDETAGVHIYLSGAPPSVQFGDRIQLRGTIAEDYETRSDSSSIVLTDGTILVKNRGSMLRPPVLPLSDVFDDPGTHEGILIETSGIVRYAVLDGDLLRMEIAEKGFRIPVTVRNYHSGAPESLLDTRVAIRGVVEQSYNPWEHDIAHNSNLGPLVQVAKDSDLTTQDPAPTSVPLSSSVRSLIMDKHWIDHGRRARVRGIVHKIESDNVLTIESDGVVMPVETPDARKFNPGAFIEAMGWPTPRRFTVTLQRSIVSYINQNESMEARGEVKKDLPTITSIKGIRSMSESEAARGLPVDITAVLTNVQVLGDSYILQADGEAIYVDASDENMEPYKIGQLVRVHGIAAPGGFAPVIIHPQMEVLGNHMLPTPRQVLPEVAPTGAYDSQWVEMEGVIRPIKLTRNGYIFNFVTALGTVVGQFMSLDEPNDLTQLVDARVKVRGVFATLFNKERSLTGYRIIIDSPKYITIITKGPNKAETIAITPANELLQFTTRRLGSNRAKIHATVTLSTTNELIVQDETGSLRVKASGRGTHPGDIIEAIGYPVPSENGPILTDAIVHVVDKSASTLVPTTVTADQVMNRNVDNQLVTIYARLVNIGATGSLQTLVMQDKYVTFNAVLNDGSGLDAFREGSFLKITGVCSVQRERQLDRDFSELHSVSFRILLRSADDLQIVQSAPWWNLQRVWPVLAALTFVIVVSLLWVRTLRQRVRSQTSELEQQRSFLRQIIDLCPPFIFVSDRENRFTLVNRAFAETRGLAPEQMLGKTPSELAMDQHVAMPAVDQKHEVMITRQDKIVPEQQYTDVRGNTHWLHMVNRPIVDTNGIASHVLCVANDITLHKEAAAAMQKARETAEAASQAKSEFLANMSHEIRTPLNGIIGTTLLCLETELNREQREYVETTKMSADGLLTVINDILDYSKIEAGKMELDPIPFSVRETIEATLKTLALRAHQKDLELDYDMAPDVPEALIGDQNRLRQILLNLAGNAIKFTERGEVTVKVTLLAQTDDNVTALFVVEDTGIGIPPERQHHIFDPFAQADSSTTRKFGGTGLGLTICARLVTMMGGHITVASEVGKGSAFSFTIQLKRDNTAQLPALPEVALNQLRVLVVDDNSSYTHIVNQQLTQWNMRPVVCNNAKDALRLIEQAKNENDPIKLALIEYGIPKLSGLNLIEQIHRQYADLTKVIVILRTTEHREGAAYCQALGIEHYLVKPLRSSELRDTLQRSINGSPPAVQRASTTVNHSTSLNILVAEDNQVNQLVLQRMLTKRGHHVTLAVNGKRAYEAAITNRFDLIFMDVQMPDMDGFESTAAIRRWESGRDLHVPIVALTAHAMSGDQERCISAGMDGYMTKPVNPVELDEVLRKQAPAQPPAGSIQGTATG